MVKGQHVDTGDEAYALRSLSRRREKHILGRGKAVHGRRVVLCQMISVKTGRFKVPQEDQSLSVNLVQLLATNRLNMIENAKPERHFNFPSHGIGIAQQRLTLAHVFVHAVAGGQPKVNIALRVDPHAVGVANFPARQHFAVTIPNADIGRVAIGLLLAHVE